MAVHLFLIPACIRIMEHIIVFGKTAVEAVRSILGCSSAEQVREVISLREYQDELQAGRAGLLVVSRDAPGIDADRFFGTGGEGGSASLLFISPRGDELEKGVLLLTGPSLHLRDENQRLKAKITILNGVIKSLLTALSQYDLTYGEFTGEDDAWNLLMQSLPAAEALPDILPSGGEDGEAEDEDDDGTDGC